MRYGAKVMILDQHKRAKIADVRRRLEHIACGDKIKYSKNAAGELVVTEIDERKNALQRTDFRQKTKTLACNIDQLIIVTACRPEPDWELVDQMIVAGINMDVEILLLAHKSDLACAADIRAMHEYYQQIGHTSLSTSRDDEQSLLGLEGALKGKINVLVGQSGMGKSSLAKYLIGHSEIKVGELSERTGLGQHTTSVAQCYPLPQDAYLIDSPGVRDFSPPPLSANKISAGFLEIHAAALHCKFHNCRHLKEPKCEVKARVEAGNISERRLDSYTRLLSSSEEKL